MTVSGAYGRDYKSAKAALADWEAGKDFVIRDLMCGAGSYVNKADVETMGPSSVTIRYNADRGVTVWRRKAK